MMHIYRKLLFLLYLARIHAFRTEDNGPSFNERNAENLHDFTTEKKGPSFNDSNAPTPHAFRTKDKGLSINKSHAAKHHAFMTDDRTPSINKSNTEPSKNESNHPLTKQDGIRNASIETAPTSPLPPTLMTTRPELLQDPRALRDLLPAEKWRTKRLRIPPTQWPDSGSHIHQPDLKGGNHVLLIACVVFPVFNPLFKSRALHFGVALWLIPAVPAQSLVGYDTAGRFSPDKVIMKTVSLLGVESCDQSQSQSYLEPLNHQIQVIYQPTETLIKMLQCRILVTTELLHCESNMIRSDIYPPEYMTKDKVVLISADECRNMFSSRTYDLELYEKLVRIKGITHSPITQIKLLVGSRTTNGGCVGGRINLGTTTRDKVVVRLTIVHSVKEIKGKYSLGTNTIVVKDLVSLSAGGIAESSCDQSYGCFYPAAPDGLPTTECEGTLEFIKGSAKVYHPNTSPGQTHQGYLDIIQISSDTDVTQGTTLTLGDISIICQTMVRRTNVPRLYVNFYDNGENHRMISHRLMNGSGQGQNQHRLVDVLTASSNIYLRGTLSISEQFDKVSFRLCELRRAALLAILRDLLTSGPAPLLNYREGILFRRVGSVAYIFLGVPVSARLRPTEECYNEIPVTLETDAGEHDAFLTSKGRIIVSNGTRIICGDRSAMHFVRDELTEGASLNKSLDLFPDLAFSSEINENHLKGSWLCQYPGKFVACEPPSSLSPLLIGDSDLHFLGIKGRFLQQSIFGDAGREELYRSQTEGYNQQVVWTMITHGSDASMSASAGDILVGSLSETARKHIRMIVLPTMYFIFGDLLTYVHQFILVMFLLSFIYGLGTMVGRVCMVYRKCGFSRYLVLAIFEGVHNAIIPWRSASIRSKRNMDELQTKIGELSRELDAKVDAHAVEVRTMILEPPKLSLSQSPTTLLRQKNNLYPPMRSIPMCSLLPYHDDVPNAPINTD